MAKVNGSKIRQLREECGMTAEQLGEKVYVTQVAITKIENNVTAPSAELLKRIADYFGCATDDLYTDETPKNATSSALRD